METAALVSDDAIAKRKERFTSQLDKEEAKKILERQQRFNPDAGKQAERKERFQKWLPSGGSSAPGMSKPANATVAAAIGTSLDNTSKASLAGKGAKNRAGSTAAITENFSDEFKAKAEVSAHAAEAAIQSIWGLRLQSPTSSCMLQASQHVLELSSRSWHVHRHMSLLQRHNGV